MLSNLTVALVIVASAATATEWGGEFGAYGSKQQIHSNSSTAYNPRSSRYGAHSSHGSSSYSPRSSGYGNHSNGYGYGQNYGYSTREAYPEHSYNFNPRPVAHKPEYTHAPAQHYGSSSYAPKSSYGYEHPEPQGCVLPPAPTFEQSTEYDGTWWTPNLQYSPPLIKYEVAAGIPKEGLYAICPLATVDASVAGTFAAGDVTGDLLFSQLPHQTVKVSASLTQEAAGVPGAELMFRILKTGDVTIAMAAGNCPLLADIEGEEFNNLEEVKGGLANPYADPTRGRIDTAVTPALQTDKIVIDQVDLLQNLAGHDSIIGRAIVIVKEGAPNVVSGCCVIARSSDPTDLLSAKQVWLRPQVVAVPGQYRYVKPVRTITAAPPPPSCPNGCCIMTGPEGPNCCLCRGG